MFKKVIIAEDQGGVNKGLSSTLKEIGITIVDQVQYCDDAYLKIKAAYKKNDPYELLITDLSFKADYREQKIPSGEVLLSLIKQEHPELKTMVYSVEERIQKVRLLIENYGVRAYVCKGRKGLEEVTIGITNVFNEKMFLSPQVEHALNQKTAIEIEDYDIELLKQLAKGYVQQEIADYFKQHHISPSSLSTVEKRLNKLRLQLNAKNVTQLVATAKDLGLI